MSTTSQLRHIAIIPDGNRRWARQHGIAEQHVYKHGTDQLFDVLETALAGGVQHVTIWVSSYSNLVNRPKALVSALEKIYVKKFQELRRHPIVEEYGVCVNACGEWRDILKQSTIEVVDDTIAATAHHTKRFLTVLIGYDGRRERGAAVQSLICGMPYADCPEDGDQLLRQHSWTGHLPEVDLVIRTGAHKDPHMSAGFLSLLTSESQFAFPDMLWPDFNGTALSTIMDEFVQRERRYGT